MCGITGIVNRDVMRHHLGEWIHKMNETLHHRGPDAGDIWVDPNSGIALGHRRLSIIDLSSAGAQPMESNSGRYIIVYNGEIYNHNEIRKELDSKSQNKWRGHSDTETLLAAFEEWGVEAALKKAIGMFAIALWDRKERILYLCRDRFGEKPLYYGWVGKTFLFASELKAFKAFPGFDNEIDRDVLAAYMRYVYVPAPFSIYKNIYKLEPGCFLTLTEESCGRIEPKPLRPDFQKNGKSMKRYWSLADVISQGSKNLIRDENQAIELLEKKISDAVKFQSLADVPLGAFLSGGIDSSTIVSLMQKQSSIPVKTFTIGFEESGFDESPHAKAVAKHLGTEHYELFVTSEETRSVIPKLPHLYDEPFADSSQIPTHLVCKAARNHVTVALSGDAGDELFGGYNRYFWAKRIWAKLSWMPYSIRKIIGSTVLSVPPSGWDKIGNIAKQMHLSNKNFKQIGDKAHKLAARLQGVQNLDGLYLSLISEWREPSELVIGSNEVRSIFDDPYPNEGMDSHELKMMYKDSITYLPDDILCKVDRAAMGISLETRVPFLDHRLAEFAWQLPLNMKIRNGQGKWALRQVLYKHVPKELIERPKAGFGIPVGEWIKVSLKEWAEDLLSEETLKKEGFFELKPILQKWKEHKSGSHNWTHSLWSVLMFEAWLREQK
ncbi:MAG: asparagine synthase (glutamine-hydrolyzing) [Leptospiraceae bacterium]|nr:asparagine synthase (glutamine-hydrolyzing) [Leptospiraceae bacterium]